MKRGEAKVGQRVTVTSFGVRSFGVVHRIQSNGDLVIMRDDDELPAGTPRVGLFDPADVEPSRQKKMGPTKLTIA